MSRSRFCAVPSPTEHQLAMIPGSEPGTALRVSVEPGHEGYVRLEHLAFNTDLGWYTQKSFCIEAEMLEALVPALRKADCLVPKSAATPSAGPTLRLSHPVCESDRPRLSRRNA